MSEAVSPVPKCTPTRWFKVTFWSLTCLETHPGKLTCQWKMDRLKMYLLLKKMIFHCHVSVFFRVGHHFCSRYFQGFLVLLGCCFLSRAILFPPTFKQRKPVKNDDIWKTILEFGHFCRGKQLNFKKNVLRFSILVCNRIPQTIPFGKRTWQWKMDLDWRCIP